VSAARLRVNRAPVLTLWAAVVAERLGHPPETALTLGSALAGTTARAKARRLGIDEAGEKHRQHERAAEAVHLLGRDIPVLRAADGSLHSASEGDRPASAKAVRAYLARAFGAGLEEARAAMEALAAGFEAGELNRIGFRLYERFRPAVPEDVSGWGAKGVLDLGQVRAAGERHP
jgi:hypothetical protein